MTVIAVTGHMNLTPPTEEIVGESIRNLLTRYPDLTGVTCLAEGADTVFAWAIVSAGGVLRVILPAKDYRERKVKPNHAPEFDELVSLAADVEILPYDRADRAAYEAANEVMLSSCDLLLAVWDGVTTTTQGGTASVVATARSRGISVDVIWPEGAQRR